MGKMDKREQDCCFVFPRCQRRTAGDAVPLHFAATVAIALVLWSTTAVTALSAPQSQSQSQLPSQSRSQSQSQPPHLSQPQPQPQLLLAFSDNPAGVGGGAVGSGSTPAAVGDDANPAHNSTAGSDSELHLEDGLKYLGITTLLVVNVLLAVFLERNERLGRFLPASAATMLFGSALGLLLFVPAVWEVKEKFLFSPEYFYYILLPPIVFEAGYSLKKKDFFRNAGSILLFAVIGTVVSAFVVGYGLWGLGRLGWINEVAGNHPLEGLVFGSLISAIDPIATLALLGSRELNVDARLYSLVFGESVLNDAVSIVMFRTFSAYSDTSSFTTGDAGLALLKFVGVCIGSVGVGFAVGLFSAFSLRRLALASTVTPTDAARIMTHGEKAEVGPSLLPQVQQQQQQQPLLSDYDAANVQASDQQAVHNVNDNSASVGNRQRWSDATSPLPMAPSTADRESATPDSSARDNGSVLDPNIEVLLVLCFAYSSYLCAEVIGMSGVMALFFCAITMQHYMWYSLSADAQVTSRHAFKALAQMAETAVFLYLGVSVFAFKGTDWSPRFIALSLLLCLVARAVHVFPLAALANLRRKHKITWQMQAMIWFAGLRGAIAFALSLNLPASVEHRNSMITATLFIVFFTTFLQGSATSPVVAWLGLKMPRGTGGAADSENAGSDTTYSGRGSEAESLLGHRSIGADGSSIPPVKHSIVVGDRLLLDERSRLHQGWRRFDDQWLKPLFGGRPRADLQ